MPPKRQYQCSECGHVTVKWVGRCPQCGAWGSIHETEVVSSSPQRTTSIAHTQKITEVNPLSTQRKSTGISELDRVLGGGYISGSVVLLAGEPGVGKSTLLLALARAIAPGDTVLYATGEESAGQVRMRAERTGALHESIYLTATTDLDMVLAHAHNVTPAVMIVDSVQTLNAANTEGTLGGVSQIKAITAALSSYAKTHNTTVFIVGHVTKDGLIAGPRTLEHLVDVVLHFEGDKNTSLRMIRAIKNRYGSVDELGCFEQREHGIVPIDDPTSLFIQVLQNPVPGSAITVTMDGRRPLLAEVQVLVVPTHSPSPRRAVSGLDHSRLSMILAVLERRCKVSIMSAEVYAATVGGVKIVEPAIDLAIALAAAGAVMDQPLQPHLAICGEVGLAGEIRAVRGIERRILEAVRMGFTHVITPPLDAAVKIPQNCTVHPIAHVKEAFSYAFHT